MKIIITEEQLRLIIESEEESKIEQIKNLIETFDEKNIRLAFELLKGSRMKQYELLEEYIGLFEVFNLTPNLKNFITISKKESLTSYLSEVTDLIFRLPKLEMISFYGIKNLDNLVNFDGSISVYSELQSIPNLVMVGGDLNISGGLLEDLANLVNVGGDFNLIVDDNDVSPLESIPKLESVGGGLRLDYSSITSLPSLTYVGGNLRLRRTPLGYKLRETMGVEDIKNKFGINGNIII